MPVIKVIKPFGLRQGGKAERKDFGIGEHFVNDEELAHWFVQACLKEGRAMLVAESGMETAEDAAGLATPTREELTALTVARLKEMASLCGLPLASNATKAVIVDALLANRESE